MLFLLIDHLDQRGRWGLTTPQVRAMLRADWQLGSHTYTEVALPSATPLDAWHDIHASRLFLQHSFHRPIAFFCYPVGAYNAVTEALVRRAGYLAAVTTETGDATPHSNPDALPRIRVNGNQTASSLISTLRSLTNG